MKLRGQFVVREVMGHVAAIPVGSTALTFNGMILLNDVSRVIWECLNNSSTVESITAAVTERFAVDEKEATADILEFVDKLRTAQLLDEE